jgi:hypothetical protein
MAEPDPTPEQVVAQLKQVQSEVEALRVKHNLTKLPRLVAVSKTKSVQLIKACYDAGQRHFGENYAQELMDKVPQLPADIQWHFIGHLQSNKVKKLLKVTCQSLHVIETVDSLALATTLDKALVSIDAQRTLNVFVQVNTSGETAKSGVEPNACAALVEAIRAQCPHLHVTGLMTIGALHGDASRDFEALVKCRQEVAAKLGVPLESFELSMGMSGDFAQAVALGSTNIRVGSTIFGARTYHK